MPQPHVVRAEWLRHQMGEAMTAVGTTSLAIADSYLSSCSLDFGPDDLHQSPLNAVASGCKRQAEFTAVGGN